MKTTIIEKIHFVNDDDPTNVLNATLTLSSNQIIPINSFSDLKSFFKNYNLQGFSKIEKNKQEPKKEKKSKKEKFIF